MEQAVRGEEGIRLSQVRAAKRMRPGRFARYQRAACIAVGTAALWLVTGGVGDAQSARIQAPFDPTGYWVSLITRDWRFRMIVPGRGEYEGVPLSLASKQFADAWRPTQDESAGKQCEAYGAGVVMLVPERLRISWQDDETLQVQTDAGMQTRLLHFDRTGVPGAERSWQGYSSATWVLHQVKPIGPNPVPQDARHFGILKIITTDMLAGLIRKNGLPYSDQSTLTEYWQLPRDPATQMQYLIDTASLHDPVYLIRDYYYTATFQQESGGAKWEPTACTLTSTP